MGQEYIMARRVGLRPSYNQDAAFFIRIKEALTVDAGLDREWRAKASEHLSQLVNLFMNVKRVGEKVAK